MMADEKSDILIRPNLVSDYERVCQIFSSGIREGFHTFGAPAESNPVSYSITMSRTRILRD